jgi:hypothetical protein
VPFKSRHSESRQSTIFVTVGYGDGIVRCEGSGVGPRDQSHCPAGCGAAYAETSVAYAEL